MKLNATEPESDAARSMGRLSRTLRKASYCAMGDSFFRQLCNESLSTDERAAYAADAVYMYKMGGVEHAIGSELPALLSAGAASFAPRLPDPQQGQCVDVRLVNLIAFVEQCRKTARAV